jgi:predicted ABC-type ATPase
MAGAAPILHILAGSNGAGKSSLYDSTVSRMTDAVFVNADRLIAEAIGAHATTEAHAKQGQALADAERARLMAARQSLVTESTFSHVSKVDLVRDALTLGYRVLIYHVGLESADLAVARVQERASNGGHSVPEDRIRVRYTRNRSFIRDAMLLATGGLVFDNSLLGAPPRRVVTFVGGRALLVDAILPEWVAEVYAADLTGDLGS